MREAVFQFIHDAAPELRHCWNDIQLVRHFLNVESHKQNKCGDGIAHQTQILTLKSFEVESQVTECVTEMRLESPVANSSSHL